MQWKRNGTVIDDDGEKFVYQHHSVDQEQVLILEIHNISVSLFKFKIISLFESHSWWGVLYAIYVIKFVGDLRHVGGFLRVL